MRITRYSVNRKPAVIAMVAALAVLGLYGLRNLPVDYLPSITYPLVKVQIKWPGAGPDEIDREIADPVERIMSTVDNLDYLESSAIEGMYTLMVNFEYGISVDVAFQDVLAALTRAQPLLPPDIESPYVLKADPSQHPVLQVTIGSDRWSPVKLRDWADNWLQDRILAVGGVAGTEVIGGLEREIRIQLDPAAMEKYGISLDMVLKRLAAENIEQTVGRVTVGPKDILARITGEFTSLDDIREVVIAEEGFQKVRLGDIADVNDSHREERIITRFNGNNCVKISVLKQAKANTVKVAERVNRLLRELKPNLPEGIELGYVEDQSEYIKQALGSVSNAALTAAVLLITVIYLFLGSVRQVLIMVIALPLTLLFNFGLMKLAGFSINIISLGGLVVAIGVVLDNSIVVVENITRLRRVRAGGDASRDAIEATTEVGPALIAATLSFLALFVPFLVVPGLTALLFRELILVIAGIVVIGLVMAVTVTPMISTILFGKYPKAREQSRFERLFAWFTEYYGMALERIIHRPRTTVVIFALLLAVAVMLSGKLAGDFLPLIDDGRIIVKIKMPTGATVRETDSVCRRVEALIGNDPLVQSTFALVGGKVMRMITYEISNEGEVDIQLVPKRKRKISTDKYIAGLRNKIGPLQPPGGKIMVKQMPIKGIPGIQAADIIVKVRGHDMNILNDLAGKTVQTMNGVNGIQNVIISMDLTRPEYRVKVDRIKAAELGVSVSEVASALRTLITGAVASRYRDGMEYYDIRLLIPEKRLSARHDIENLAIPGSHGVIVRLRDVASVVPATGPVEIIREDQIKQITVQADIAGGNLAGAVQKIRTAIDGFDLPVGYEFDFGGSAELMADMKNSALAVLAFALFFAFIILTVQFNTFTLPVLVLGSVPFCLTGVVFLMFFTQIPIGATVIIGILVVMAATINDGVLLLTYAPELTIQQNSTPQRAVIEAAKIRLRPRIMTTVSTMTGFLLLALNLGEGGDILQPMAVAAIGGLIMEIFVALFLMPCMYVMTLRKQG
jgi:HAE1 family hydrophobic/amphiphilic exporter-1